MKHLIPILTLILLLAGCSGRRTVDPRLRWEAIDADFDEVAVRLERDFMDAAADSIFLPRLDTLVSMAEKPSAPRQLRSRAEYWRAIAMSRNGHNGNAPQHIARAISLCDSSRYPYDMERYRLLECVFNNKGNYDYYLSLKRGRDYFEATDDPYMLGWTGLSLGELFISISDLRRASQYFFEADSLLRIAKADSWSSKSRLNNANILCELGDTAAALKILDRLLTDPMTLKDTAFYTAVLTDKYVIDGDTSSLRTACGMLGHPQWSDVKQTIYLSLAENSARLGRADSTEKYLSRALAMLNGVRSSADNRLTVYKAALSAYKTLGLTDSVNAYSLRICDIQDSVLSEHNTFNIINSETLAEISKNDEEMASRRKIERMWILLGGAAILLIAGAALFVIYHRMQSHRLAELRTNLELEKERRRLVSSALAMTEKDNLIELVIDDIADIRRSDDMAKRLEQLQQSLKMHLSGRQDWEIFKVMFENVHPRFSTLLKERYPDVTEGDIRLAIYIRAGLTTKQISRMLMLQPDSVKKNRKRLRRHLNLTTADSLEDLLRNISDT